MAPGAHGFSRRSLGCLLTCLALALLLERQLVAATIYVEGSCTLAKAITAANSDTSGGDCIAGSGSDVIELSGDVTLTAVDNSHDGTGANGLPIIITDIRIEGKGWSIERGGGTPEFRILKVSGGGNLTLSQVAVRNGRITTNGSQIQGGGAILNFSTLTIDHSTVSGSQVVGIGWGAVGGGIQSSGALVVKASTIALNGATSTTHGASGGGILSTGSVEITNSTISGNYAVSTVSWGNGGGLALLNVTSALIRNCTLSGNAADGIPEGGGAALLARDTTTVRGSIFANSLFSENCVGTPELTDGDGNLSDDDSCATISDTLSGLDPVLRDNGGPTRTHALLDGSSAILGASSCGLFKDQRGAPRGFFCDSGAFEHGGCPEIVLSDDTVLAAEVHESCQIQAGTNYCVIGPFGDLTLRAGREIRLGDGFCVGVDAGLTLEIDSDLIP